MTIRMIPVTEKTQITAVCRLAEEIWHDAYDALLPPGQTVYMIEKFQSPAAVTKQMEAAGYQYYLIETSGEHVGFLAIVPNHKRAGEMLLSKIYLLSACRGQGVIRRAFSFIFDFARENRIHKIWLTVNKENFHAQAVYRHFGFQTTDSVKADIGNGYFMDDYIMECVLAAKGQSS